MDSTPKRRKKQGFFPRVGKDALLRRKLELEKVRSQLPVFKGMFPVLMGPFNVKSYMFFTLAERKRILRTLANNNTMIVVGETGSGKTTRA
jgi:ABC-type microcin C transport system duplicated ATPase subunit YejF